MTLDEKGASKWNSHGVGILGKQDQAGLIRRIRLLSNVTYTDKKKEQSDAQNSFQCEVPKTSLVYVALLYFTRSYFRDSNL